MNSNLICLALQVTGLLVISRVLAYPSPPNFGDLFNFNQLGKLPDGEVIDPLDYLLEDYFPKFYGQSANNENGSKAEFKDYALNDTSNDDAAKLSGLELIERSGFKYETYDAIADDGYITELVHLINPLADHNYLRQPPILLEHGGTIDPTAYLIASSIQHHPEKWPRTGADGPITSWNRSLAFVLANNGFDVWLAETRGSNDKNTRRVRRRAVKSILDGKNDDKNMTTGENIFELIGTLNYWSFSQDDIIAHELKSHMDTVLNLTGAEKLHLFTYSLSTPSSLAFFSIRPDYAEKVQGYVSMAPIVSGHGVSKVIKFFFQTLCPLMPENLGTMAFTDGLLNQPVRDLFVAMSKEKKFRYSWAKAATTMSMGPSAKYQTLLDLNVIGHLMRRLSFKELKQMCQQTASNKLQKYDYGPIRNQFVYRQFEPPVYELKNLKIKDWIIVSAANDQLSTQESIAHLISIVEPKPVAHIVAPGFNHLDLIAGWENDKYVNLPVLHYFEKLSYTPGDESTGGPQERARSARSLDLNSFMPLELLNPKKAMDRMKNVTQPFNLMVGGPLEISLALERIRSEFDKLVSGFAKNDVTKLLRFDSLFKKKEPEEARAKSADHEAAKKSDESEAKVEPKASAETMWPVANTLPIISSLASAARAFNSLGDRFQMAVNQSTRASDSGEHKVREMNVV